MVSSQFSRCWTEHLHWFLRTSLANAQASCSSRPSWRRSVWRGHRHVPYFGALFPYSSSCWLYLFGTSPPPSHSMRLGMFHRGMSYESSLQGLRGVHLFHLGFRSLHQRSTMIMMMWIKCSDMSRAIFCFQGSSQVLRIWNSKWKMSASWWHLGGSMTKRYKESRSLSCFWHWDRWHPNLQEERKAEASRREFWLDWTVDCWDKRGTVRNHGFVAESCTTLCHCSFWHVLLRSEKWFSQEFTVSYRVVHEAVIHRSHVPLSTSVVRMHFISSYFIYALAGLSVWLSVCLFVRLSYVI